MKTTTFLAFTLAAAAATPAVAATTLDVLPDGSVEVVMSGGSLDRARTTYTPRAGDVVARDGYLTIGDLPLALDGARVSRGVDGSTRITGGFRILAADRIQARGLLYSIALPQSCGTGAPAGSLDTTFDGDGTLVDPIFFPSPSPNGMLVTSDGKIKVTGNLQAAPYLRTVRTDGSIVDAEVLGDAWNPTHRSATATTIVERANPVPGNAAVYVAGTIARSNGGVNVFVQRWESDLAPMTSIELDFGGLTAVPQSLAFQYQDLVNGPANGVIVSGYVLDGAARRPFSKRVGGYLPLQLTGGEIGTKGYLGGDDAPTGIFDAIAVNDGANDSNDSLWNSAMVLGGCQGGMPFVQLTTAGNYAHPLDVSINDHEHLPRQITFVDGDYDVACVTSILKDDAPLGCDPGGFTLPGEKKFVVAGWARSGSSYAPFVARYHANLEIDESFGVDGVYVGPPDGGWGPRKYELLLTNGGAWRYALVGNYGQGPALIGIDDEGAQVGEPVPFHPASADNTARSFVFGAGKAQAGKLVVVTGHGHSLTDTQAETLEISRVK